ncbi:DUF7344 domain-containing protein [Halobellus rarus]|uniref:DUF7344 domain-containing protein n=1 Tax=Halobellus rarus TaxID=1126237 RepID=A0ABD6CPM1_9EURY|nr:hypothetical protein [Halobellus rarus]
MSPGNGEGELSTDEALELLADETRYQLLRTFCERDIGDDGRVDLPELLETLSETSKTEGDGPASESDARRERLTVELRHNHLPRLDSRGVIDWDAEADTVARGPTFGELRPLVELLDEHTDELPGNW